MIVIDQTMFIFIIIMSIFGPCEYNSVDIDNLLLYAGVGVRILDYKVPK